MATYVAFLRAINVGKRPYPMAELRAVLAEAGFEGVQTHIQTGNVLLTSTRRSAVRLAEELEAIFEADRGFEVPTVVVTQEQLVAVAAECDAVEAEYGTPGFGHYVELTREPISGAAKTIVEGQDIPGQRAIVRGSAVHLLFDVPYHEAKGPSAEVKRAYGISTNRNATVIRALATKWG